MKQILYIPSGSYFLWFDSTKETLDNIPSLSSEELLIKDKVWCENNEMTDIESILNQIITNYQHFNPFLYKCAGIDDPTNLSISEFEIIEV